MNTLIGLVACGGKSSRMGLDKSLLKYFDKAQRYHCYDLLSEICDEVYLSCSKGQALQIQKGYNFIQDAEEFSDIGPMAALLTAHTIKPNASFLLLGCDYPLVKIDTLKLLVSNRNKTNAAVSIYNSTTDFFEPLLSVYENSSMPDLKEHYVQNKFSLQQFLKELNAKKVIPVHPAQIKSVDTPEEVEKIRVSN